MARAKQLSGAQQLILELSDLQGSDPAEVVLYALHNTEAFLGRLKAALSEFYEVFVKPDLPRALAFLEEKRSKHQMLLDEGGKIFLNRITLDNYSSLYSPEDEIRIVISYYASVKAAAMVREGVGRPLFTYHGHYVVSYRKTHLQPAGAISHG